MLVGGAGADILRGQGGSDLLIAGGLNVLADDRGRFDTDVEAVANVWRRDVSAEKRVRRLGAVLRDGDAGLNDGDRDRLKGGAGADAVLAQAGDRVRGADSDDLFAGADWLLAG